jgi:hypothetical protein
MAEIWRGFFRSPCLKTPTQPAYLRESAQLGQAIDLTVGFVADWAAFAGKEKLTSITGIARRTCLLAPLSRRLEVHKEPARFAYIGAMAIFVPQAPGSCCLLRNRQMHLYSGSMSPLR